MQNFWNIFARNVTFQLHYFGWETVFQMCFTWFSHIYSLNALFVSLYMTVILNWCLVTQTVSGLKCKLKNHITMHSENRKYQLSKIGENTSKTSWELLQYNIIYKHFSTWSLWSNPKTDSIYICLVLFICDQIFWDWCNYEI